MKTKTITKMQNLVKMMKSESANVFRDIMCDKRGFQVVIGGPYGKTIKNANYGISKYKDAIVIHDIGHQFDIGGMPHMTTTLYRDKYAVEMFDLLLANLAA